MLVFIFLFIINNVSGVLLQEASPMVQTFLGGIQGSYKESYNGRRYAAYEGIPYALPPTLERRFQVIKINQTVHFLTFFFDLLSMIIVSNFSLLNQLLVGLGIYLLRNLVVVVFNIRMYLKTLTIESKEMKIAFI